MISATLMNLGIGLNAAKLIAQAAPPAQQGQNDSKFFLEYLDYEERVYSKARKTELGEKTDLDLALRYQYSADTFARFRIYTDPVENPEYSKTSKIELLAFH